MPVKITIEWTIAGLNESDAFHVVDSALDMGVVQDTLREWAETMGLDCIESLNAEAKVEEVANG